MKHKHILLILVLLAGICSCSSGKIRRYKVEIVAEYPHDVTSYTQGLFFNNGKLYESTGLYGESTFREVDLKTGKALKRMDFDDKYFAEGSVIFKDSLYILTWENRAAFVYDAATLEYSTTWNYPREGWGLTTDGEQLIASDGSARLYFMDEDYQFKSNVVVKSNGRPVRWLNELEYIDGKIWANVYTTDLIVIINPKNGKVEGQIDCTGLLPKNLYTDKTDVLNGIAYNPQTGQIFLTGKCWPKMYEIKLKKAR